MVDINDCYFHSINLDSERSLQIFDKILIDGKILSFVKSSFSSCDFRMNMEDETDIVKKKVR